MKSDRLLSSHRILTSTKCKQMAKNPVDMKSSTKNDIPHFKFFFFLKYNAFPIYWWFEKLSSSSCWRIMVIYNRGVVYPGTAFVGVTFFTRVWFLIHNFGSKCARKPIKGSKDADHSLVAIKTWAKNGSVGWRTALGKVGQKVAKTYPHRNVTPRKPQTRNGKKR